MQKKDQPLVADRRGKLSVIVMSVRDYIPECRPTPAAYRAIRQEANRNGSSALSIREIDREIASHRRQAGGNCDRSAECSGR